MRYWISIALLLAAALPVWSQRPAAIRRSSLPIWTGQQVGGARALNLEAYYDPQTDEILLRAPGDGSGEVRYDRFRIPAQPRPHVRSTVTPSGDGSFVYRYQLVDVSADHPRTTAFSLLVPGGDVTPQAEAAVWNLHTEQTNQPDRTTFRNFGTLARLVWTRPAGGSAPGVEIRLVSKLLPGFTSAEAVSSLDPPIPETALARLSPGTRAAVERMLAQRGAYHPVVLAPLFAAETPKQIVAGSFHFGISRLVTRRELNGEGEFVRAVLPLLDYAARSNVVLSSEIERLEPSTDLEREIKQALLVALR